MKNHLLKAKLEDYEAEKPEYFDDDKCHNDLNASYIATRMARLITELTFEIEKLENVIENAKQQLNK